MFNILYKKNKIYSNLSHEELAEILDELSEKYYDTGEYNPNDIILEEFLNGTETEPKRTTN
jgi:hypothetical protein